MSIFIIDTLEVNKFKSIVLLAKSQSFFCISTPSILLLVRLDKMSGIIPLPQHKSTIFLSLKRIEV